MPEMRRDNERQREDVAPRSVREDRHAAERLALGVLATPVLGYLLSPILRGERGQYKRWVSLGQLDEFPEGQTRLATFQNPISTSTGTATPITFRAGCAASRASSSRCSRSIAPTSDARCAGSRNPACSCAPATAACTTRTARTPPVRRRADCLSTSTRLRTAS